MRKAERFATPAKPRCNLRKKRFVRDAVAVRHFVFVVAQERDVDLFLLRPGFLGKGVVAADAIDLAMEIAILAQAVADTAHLSRAGAGKGHRKEEQKRVLDCRNFRSTEPGAARPRSWWEE